MHRYQQFRRIGNFDKPGACHLEYGNLGSGAETVLDAAKKPVRSPVVPLELQHNIDYMLKNLRSRDASLLGDVTDENDRDSSLLGETEKHRRCFLNLRDGTRR